MNPPPNIIFVVSEQHKASAASIGGNPHVPTPFLDHMAREGIVYENAFTCAPICTPSRTTMATGVHPLVHQCTCHQNRAPVNLPLLSELLSDAGYWTSVIGHYERQRNLGRGYSEQIDLTDYRLKAAYQQKLASGRSDIGWSNGSIPCQESEGLTHLMTERIIHMIDDAQRAKAPFFLHLCYDDAHAPYFVPPPFGTLIDPESLPLPPDGTETGRPAWHTTARKEYGTDLATPADFRKVLAAYYGMIACVDHSMQRVHQALADRGALENTWIVFTSDHGDYTGEKGLFTKSESLYECLLHVPLAIMPPRGMNAPRGQRVSELVETVDLFATVLGLAGVEVPAYAQSRDLVATLQDGHLQPPRESVFAQVGDYHGHLSRSLPTGFAPSGRHPSLVEGVRTTTHSYMRDPDYGDEAYDLRHDPHELNNLLNPGQGPAPAEIDGLRRQVDAFHEDCLRLRDEIGVIPGARGFEPGWE